MARPQTASLTLAAASATAICASQTPGAAGALTINGGSASGGVATLDVNRRVLVTTAGAEAGKTLTVTGTTKQGVPLSEVLALPSVGTVFTLQDFYTITAAVISAAAAGAITVGTNGVASTVWLPVSYQAAVFNVGLAVNFGGVTASIQVEVTLDPESRSAVDARPGGNGDNSAAGLPSSTFATPVTYPVGGLSAITTDGISALTIPVRAVRMTVLSGAATPGVRLTVIQAGNVN